MAQKQLLQQLRDVGTKLESPPASKDALIKLLKQAANYLSELDQSPLASILEVMKPSLSAIAKPELLKHQDRDVKVLVATCICEITRITAPEPPYSDEILREIFQLFVGIFNGLSDINSPSFGRRVLILETLAKYRSCVMMLDLECNDLINDLFSTLFAVVSDDHPESVLISMQTIMTLILDESEEIEENLLFIILSTLGRKRSDASLAARKLAMNVINHCAGKLEIPIKQFLLSSISGDRSALSNPIDYHEVIYDIYQCAPQILFGIIPYITGELLTDQLDVRREAVKLLGDLFALPGISISEAFKPLFSELLKRLTDRVVEVRISVVEHMKNCLISNPFRAEALEIISALSDRLLDYDENVRRKVVAAIFDVSCHALGSIPSATIKLVAERLRDKSISVKRYTMERLAELYRFYCQNCSDGSNTSDDFEWIPGKILRCLYDKDFRSDTIEDILCCSLFPSGFSIKDKVKHWITMFSGFEKIEVKALEQVLIQKQRIQQEMQKYLSLRQTCQDGDGPEHQKKILGCFRTLSRLFSDPVKTEESFQILNQLKDANIWKILTCLLDPCTNFNQAWTYREELLKILGEKHPLYDFMGALSMKCSYLFFNKEFVKEVLFMAAEKKNDGNTELQPCMNFLAVLASFFPFLLSGFEEDLVCLLKEDNEVAKEGIAHVLAKAGGIIREKLSTTSSSVDLLLERLCLEGSRKQAKYAVQALTAITKDDGLKSLSVLYKRLVDMLEEKTHLPAILQSLGCIAQNAMPIYETREAEIVDFITKKILESNNKEDNSKQKPDWSHRSELCLLKIFGLKTLVKSYTPTKDAHLRVGIEKLIGKLKNIMLFGGISENIESSPVDKAHLRLAAAKAVLRLSRQWDRKIPVDVFYLTLKTSQDPYPEARKLFTNKVHQYIKEHFLDAKYACAFLYNITESHPTGIAEDKHNLKEVVQIHHQLKARQLSVQCDMNPLMAYPEYIVPYFVHALAHNPSFPNVDDRENVQAFEPIYWRLHTFLSALLLGDEPSRMSAYSNRTKESFSTVLAIFQSILSSEDIIDGTKTKNSHALCDLGVSIAKCLVRQQGDLNELAGSVPLPEQIYRPRNKNVDEGCPVNNEKAWLGGDSAMAHFESLKLEKKISPASIKDEMTSQDGDKEATELPLRTIIDKLKTQVAIKKKSMQNQTSHSEIKNSEVEVDVLGMLREINLGSQGQQSMEAHKFGKENKHSATGLTPTPDKNNKHLDSPKTRRDMAMDLIPLSTPKRKRSNPRSHSKGSTMADKVVTDSKLLVSCLPMAKTILSGSKKRGTNQNPNGRSHVGEDNLKNSSFPDNLEKKSSTLSTDHNKKRKLKSISVLEKCSQNIIKSSTELVGCRIKVWWPLDKQFYDGRVQSYDPAKKKHVILYNDGDVEVLHLDKERWEIIDDDNMPRKKPKTQHNYSSEELSPEENGINIKDIQKKKPNKKILSSNRSREKTTKQKHGSNKKSERKTTMDSSDASSVDSSSASKAEAHDSSQVDDAHSGDSRKKLAQSAEGEDATEDEKQDSSCSNGEENSDDEPLNVWRQRAIK